MRNPGAMINHEDATEVKQLCAGLRYFGIDLKSYDPFWREKEKSAARSSQENAKVNELIAARKAARAAKDFKESDRIRDELAKMGIALKDSKDP